MINRIIDYAKIVANSLGKGYSESIYQEALCAHLRTSSITYNKEQIIPIPYKIDNDIYFLGNVRADIVVPDECLVIECKAIEGNLRNVHIPQIISYLKLLDFKKGLLLNFNQNPSKEVLEIIEIEKKDNLYKVKNDFYDNSCCCLDKLQ